MQTVPALQAARVPAVMPSLRSWECSRLLDRRPRRSSRSQPRALMACPRIPLRRPSSRLSAAARRGRRGNDRSATRPPGSAGGESLVRETASATLPVVTSSRVPPEDRAGLPANTAGHHGAHRAAVLPVVPEQSGPGALSPAVVQRRPPLPLAAGPAGPPADRRSRPPDRVTAGRPRCPGLSGRGGPHPGAAERPCQSRHAASRGRLDQVDIDRLADTVHARLLRRLAIERERRGGRDEHRKARMASGCSAWLPGAARWSA